MVGVTERPSRNERIVFGLEVFDKTSPPYFAADEAFGFEDVEGGGDGGSVEANGLGQFSGGRDAFAADHTAGVDGGT